MTVAESQRGTGLGRRLMEAAVDFARERRATRLYLETNSSLAPALALYRAYGFEDLPDEHRPKTDYARADVFMQRWF
jgi:ribosomal protein S18 acetylase RimI-like enzyme